jgi:hypothetical protein
MTCTLFHVLLRILTVLSVLPSKCTGLGANRRVFSGAERAMVLQWRTTAVYESSFHVLWIMTYVQYSFWKRPLICLGLILGIFNYTGLASFHSGRLHSKRKETPSSQRQNADFMTLRDYAQACVTNQRFTRCHVHTHTYVLHNSWAIRVAIPSPSQLASQRSYCQNVAVTPQYNSPCNLSRCIYTVEAGYNVMKGTEYFVSL